MMKQAMWLSAALLICTAGAATAREKAKQVSQKERTELQDLAQKYERAWNQQDADAVAQLYTKDGSMMGTMGQKADGQDQIRSQLEQTFQQEAKGGQIDITLADITPLDSKTAMVDSTFQITGAQNPNANGPGHAVVIARKEGKEWKVMGSRAFMTPQMQQGVGGAGMGHEMGGGRDETQTPPQQPQQPTDMSQPRGTMPQPPSSPDMNPQQQ